MNTPPSTTAPHPIAAFVLALVDSSPVRRIDRYELAMALGLEAVPVGVIRPFLAVADQILDDLLTLGLLQNYWSRNARRDFWGRPGDDAPPRDAHDWSRTSGSMASRHSADQGGHPLPPAPGQGTSTASASRVTNDRDA